MKITLDLNDKAAEALKEILHDAATKLPMEVATAIMSAENDGPTIQKWKDKQFVAKTILGDNFGVFLNVDVLPSWKG